MTFGDKAIAIGTVLAIGVAGLFWFNVEKTNSENIQLRKDLQAATQARNTAEWLLHNQEQTLQVFSAIRAANAAGRREDERLRDEAQKQISLILEKDQCAKRDVPAAAVEWLQRVEARVRSGGGDSATN